MKTILSIDSWPSKMTKTIRFLISWFELLTEAYIAVWSQEKDQIMFICSFNRRVYCKTTNYCLGLFFGCIQDEFNPRIRIRIYPDVDMISFWNVPEQTGHCSWGSRKGFHARGSWSPARIQPEDDDDDDEPIMMKIGLVIDFCSTGLKIALNCSVGVWA